MFDRYTREALLVVFFARSEASTYALDFITPEHLLIGMLQEPQNGLKRAFPEGTATAVLAHLRSATQPEGAGVPTAVDIPLSKEAMCVLEHAEQEANSRGVRQITPEHLLLGLLRVDTDVTRLLARHGVVYTSITDI